MLIAKNKDIHKALQIQFYKHEIRKKYVAILQYEDTYQASKTSSGEHSNRVFAKGEKGRIALPLCPSHNDRPRQMVSYDHGKEAVTEYEITDIKDGCIRINYFPLTGRTHQLRVHSAHPEGLNCPIVGDRLYGQEADRMYLHAESIDFVHPVNGERIHLEVKTPF